MPYLGMRTQVALNMVLNRHLFEILVDPSEFHSRAPGSPASYASTMQKKSNSLSIEPHMLSG